MTLGARERAEEEIRGELAPSTSLFVRPLKPPSSAPCLLTAQWSSRGRSSRSAVPAEESSCTSAASELSECLNGNPVPCRSGRLRTRARTGEDRRCEAAERVASVGLCAGLAAHPALVRLLPGGSTGIRATAPCCLPAFAAVADFHRGGWRGQRGGDRRRAWQETR